MEIVVNSLVLAITVSLCVVAVGSRTIQEKKIPRAHFDERNQDHWRLQAQWTLKNKVYASLNMRVAKNIILFLGDGMSIATLAATRVYLGSQYQQHGEELQLSFEAFPFTGLAKTYCVDQNVADSACSGTAYLTGVKANSGTVGLSGAVKRGDCQGQRENGHAVNGLMHWAQKAGKSTGIVTTTRVTHATPAAAYAHSADRKWEADSDLSKNAQLCTDIASQLVYGPVGKKIDVVFGGGRKNFLPKMEINTHTDRNRTHTGLKNDRIRYGVRNHKVDLINEWLSVKKSLGFEPKYIENREELIELDIDRYNTVLGLFSQDHMPYRLDAGDDDPNLMNMTVRAIEMLSKNPLGFFLFVEGGRIDTAHHETKARKALDETAEFAKAVEAAMTLVDPEETLIIVTADHSHTMTYSGYSKRGTDILSFSTKLNASDHMPYTTLSYANGPAVPPGQPRHNLTSDDLSNKDYTYPALVPIFRETHGGEDVAVFAKGPWAHLFSGNYEQNYLPHAIAFASCIGPDLTICEVGK